MVFQNRCLIVGLTVGMCFSFMGQAVAKQVVAGQAVVAQKPEAKQYLGGGTTVFATGRNSFSLPAANMPMLKTLDFSVGNSFFRSPWVIAPATTDVRDGLGPLFNTNGCQNCHIRDGGGHAPSSHDDNAVSLLVRISVAIEGVSWPEPNYGGQLQDFGVPGVEPEGKVHIEYQDVVEQFADGTTVTLRKPTLSITELAYGELHPDTRLSARLATPMIGLGLLEAIPEAKLMALADPQDLDNNGISGRPNTVLDVVSKKMVMGRFGWKAGQPSVRQQNTAAFAGDLGITSSLFPDENCTLAQKNCANAPTGGKPELTQEVLDAVTFYAQNLGVPARRQVNDAKTNAGEVLFESIGCAQCHTPTWTTGDAEAMPWLSNQVIYPYTDLLLHDMGNGLDDQHPESDAKGAEWRTPPLWGIGLSSVVSSEVNYLHDGRARTITEAILWHGGEAYDSQNAFKALSSEDRKALLAFIKSL